MKKSVIAVLFLFLGAGLADSSLAQPDRIVKKFLVSDDRAFKLEFEIDAGKVSFLKGTSNNIEIRMHIPEKEFDHRIEFNERRNSLFFKLDKIDWMNKDASDLQANIEVVLPNTVEMKIYGEVKAGRAEFLLGALAISEFELTVWAGEVSLDFDRPNRVKMKNFVLNTKIGQTRLRHMGNANFEFADINSGIGELDIDFDGGELDNASATIDLDIGETSVFLSDEIGVKLSVNKFLFLSNVHVPDSFIKTGRFLLSENYDTAERTMQLKITSGIGELRVRVR